MQSEKKVWCAKDRTTDWCPLKVVPSEGDTSVETMCGEFIILPWGFEKRVPDCPCTRGEHQPLSPGPDKGRGG